MVRDAEKNYKLLTLYFRFLVALGHSRFLAKTAQLRTITYPNAKLSAIKLSAPIPCNIANSELLAAIKVLSSCWVIFKSSKPIPKPAIPKTSSPIVKSVMILAASGIPAVAIQNCLG